MLKDMEVIVEIMRKRLILTHEGWNFVSDTIGGVKYHRAVSPDGWMTVIDFAGLTEDWAIEKAWAKKCSSAESQADLDQWLKGNPNRAGLVYDDIRGRFVATMFVKGGYPQEASGASPAEAVQNWKALWVK